ncbi:hypothetical protein DFJ73DRAFT_839874 [Zopfochytrium polystomum]|nr:hypothetical protein DFJ73DRAFT_839874 [Zopfochytrium polystomum]
MTSSSSSLQVEIVPNRDSIRMWKVRFPCIGPLSISGVCRILNKSTAVLSISYLEIHLRSDSYGRDHRGEDFDRLSILDSRSVIVRDFDPPESIQPLQSTAFDFRFEFTTENGTLLPPSCALTRIDPFGGQYEGHVRYELRASYKLGSSGVGTAKKVFRLPKFEPGLLITHLLSNDAFNTVKGAAPRETVKYALDLPRFLIPGNSFMVSFSVKSYAGEIYSVTIALHERMEITGLLSAKDGDRMLMMVTKTPHNSSLERFEKAFSITCPKWSAQRPTDGSAVTICPSLATRPLVISHNFRIRIDAGGTQPIEVVTPVVVLPSDNAHLTRLIKDAPIIDGRGDWKIVQLLNGLKRDGLAVLSRQIIPADNSGPSRARSGDDDPRGRRPGPSSLSAPLAPPRRVVSPSPFSSSLPASGAVAPPHYHPEPRSRGRSRGRSSERERALNGNLDEEEALLLALKQSEEEALKDFEVDPSLYARLTREPTEAVIARITASESSGIPVAAGINSRPIPPPRSANSRQSSGHLFPVPEASTLDEIHSGTPIHRGPGPLTIIENALFGSASTSPQPQSPPSDATSAKKVLKAPPRSRSRDRLPGAAGRDGGGAKRAVKPRVASAILSARDVPNERRTVLLDYDPLDPGDIKLQKFDTVVVYSVSRGKAEGYNERTGLFGKFPIAALEPL